MKYLTQDEIERLLVSIDNKRDRLLIQLGLIMGCRVSEIVSIRTKSIHPDRIQLWDEKKDRYRDVVIDSKTKALLDDYLSSEWKAKPHHRHQLFYFTSKTANRILKRWCDAARIPPEKAHWHTLRHTYVVQSLDAGVPLNYIVEQTGDSPNTIIKIYGRPSIDSRREMVKKIGVYWKV
jgi:integrase/recombinase XerC/integrase/recombinase XerD